MTEHIAYDIVNHKLKELIVCQPILSSVGFITRIILQGVWSALGGFWHECVDISTRSEK